LLVQPPTCKTCSTFISGSTGSSEGFRLAKFQNYVLYDWIFRWDMGTWSPLFLNKVIDYWTLGIQVCLKKVITPTFLFWGWDWNSQFYSREGSGFLGDNKKFPSCFFCLPFIECFLWCCFYISRIFSPFWTNVSQKRCPGYGYKGCLFL